MSARTLAPRTRRIVVAGAIIAALTAGPAAAVTSDPAVGTNASDPSVAPDAPSTDVPSTDVPSTDVPSTDVPVTDTPATETPDTETPATETPDAEVPATETPDAETPDTETPDTETPDTETPGDEDDEVPADVVVVPPSVRDGSLELTTGQTGTVDLDGLVTPGTGEVAEIALVGWSEELDLDYDEQTHVVTVTAAAAGTYWVGFDAVGLTPGANGQHESSDIATLTIVVSDAEVPAPVVAWTATPDATTTSTSARFGFSTDGDADEVGYVLDLHPEAQMATPVMVTGRTIDLTGLSVGRHTIRVVISRPGAFSALDYVWEVVGAAPAPSATPAAPVLSPSAIPAGEIVRGIRRGASGESVAVIQRALGVDADGRFGPATRAAVVGFQRAHGLVADGIVGPRTWAAILATVNGTPMATPAALSPSSIPAAQIARGIRQGARGASVTVIQRIVGADSDGLFGPRTKAAVRSWQRAHGLVADGIVGRLTWAAMTTR